MAGASTLSVHVPYQVYPLEHPVKGFPKTATETWLPAINVAIVVGHAPSKRFEAIVDSGSSVCLFHADIGKPLGLRLRDGEEDNLGGVVGGATGKVYYHQIKLKVLSHIIPITAGFSEQLSVAALLGRHGFFEHFKVTFDPSNNPPGLSIERVYKV